MLNKFLEKPTVIFHRFGGWVLVLMMLLTAGDVLLRNLFNRPILGSFEITECMMATMVASGLAYVSLTKSQIRVIVLFSLLPKGIQRVLTIITDLLSLGFCILVCWQTIVYFRIEYASDTRLGVLLIPTPPFIMIVAVGWLLLAVVLFKNFIELVRGSKK